MLVTFCTSYFFLWTFAMISPSVLIPQYIKNRQHINIKRYKQNIAIMASWWRHSLDASLVLIDTAFFLFFFGVDFLDSTFFSSSYDISLALSSENASSLLCPLVSLSLLLNFCFSLCLLSLFLCSGISRSLELSRLLELSLDFLDWGCFMLLRVLVCELPVEYPVSFLEFLGFLQKKKHKVDNLLNIT